MSSKKVLIVDDSTVTRLMIKKIIAESKPLIEFIEFDTADKAAIYLKTAESLDFVTLDQNMPGTLSGLDLAAEIRNQFPKVKVLLITANIQDAIRKQAESIGITFIEKPISPEKILPFLGGL
ncbi:response regulator [Leptospira ognonensis]|uniref:Response regulator n=1 Tax=Leptospira ognonensis TaxID=2484945 RepID=A0A4R9K4E0_9LEPT|nr:response regulator [Leptospira ognonensis]TGL60326.1 response regulator [Leptospira ognonensis]